VTPSEGRSARSGSAAGPVGASEQAASASAIGSRTSIRLQRSIFARPVQSARGAIESIGDITASVVSMSFPSSGSLRARAPAIGGDAGAARDGEHGKRRREGPSSFGSARRAE
jgi:hypothetical protein